jgi:glycosyltransferase involved in cell wall biosynthesis
MSVSKLSEELVKSGCVIEVFTTTANGPDELNVEPGKPAIVDGVKVTYFKRLTKDHTHLSPALLGRLRKQVKDFDVVHIHAWWNLVSLLACRTAIKQGVPVVVSPRGTLSAYSFTNKNTTAKRLLHKWLGKRLLQKSFLHVTSAKEKEAMENLVGSKGIFNIPNFIALPETIPASAQKNGNILKLIFFSRIEEKKGLEILLDALVSVRTPYKLTIAGDGDPLYVDKLKRIANRNAVSKNVDWIGFQGDNKFELLAQHDLLVLPSYDENFGNVVIESLSVGTAVLISKNVGLADYILENNLGWVCENSALSFNERISNIGEQRDELAKIRQQAPGKIRNDFNEENLRQQYLDMYKQIINHG